MGTCRMTNDECGAWGHAPSLMKRNCFCGNGDNGDHLGFVSLNHRPPQTGFANACPGRVAVPSRHQSSWLKRERVLTRDQLPVISSQ